MDEPNNQRPRTENELPEFHDKSRQAQNNSDSLREQLAEMSTRHVTEIAELEGQHKQQIDAYNKNEASWVKERQRLEKERDMWKEKSNNRFDDYIKETEKSAPLREELQTAKSQLQELQLSTTHDIEGLRKARGTDMAHLKESEYQLRKAQDMVTREQKDVREIKSAVKAFLNQSDDDSDFVADLARLHKTAQELPPSLTVYNIPNIRTSSGLVYQPVYSTAFDLWLQARKGALDVACATAFIVQEEFPRGQQRFLPCIHAAVCCLAPVLAARLTASEVSIFEWLRDLVLVMQLLAYIHLVSQTIEEKPE